jgi:DNA invertase Pin-like site-specific DNA recombinase
MSSPVEVESDICEIENILSHRVHMRETFYLVKWVGSKKPTWVSESEFIQTELLDEYKKYQANIASIKELTDIKQTYIYCRTSRRNGENQTSLQDQEDKCIEYANQNGYTIIGVFRDNGVSARDISNQFSLNYIISLLKPSTTIICYDISRFSRNTNQAVDVLEMIRCEKQSVVHAVYENISWDDIATNRHNFRQILSVSQLHSDTISDKVKASLEFRKKRGDHTGPIPYGYQRIVVDGTKKLIENPAEQKVISYIMDLAIDILADRIEQSEGINFVSIGKYVFGAKHYRLIMDKINQTYTNRKGKPFTVSVIKSIIYSFR